MSVEELEKLQAHYYDLQSAIIELSTEVMEVAKEMPFATDPLKLVELSTQFKTLALRYGNLSRTMISIKGLVDGSAVYGSRSGQTRGDCAS